MTELLQRAVAEIEKLPAEQWNRLADMARQEIAQG